MGVRVVKACFQVQSQDHGRTRPTVRATAATNAHEVDAAFASWREKGSKGGVGVSRKSVRCMPGATSMLPKRAQEYIHLHAKDSRGLDVLMDNRQAPCASTMGGPVPMDVGAIEEEGWEEHVAMFKVYRDSQRHLCKCGGRGCDRDRIDVHVLVEMSALSAHFPGCQRVGTGSTSNSGTCLRILFPQVSGQADGVAVLHRAEVAEETPAAAQAPCRSKLKVVLAQMSTVRCHTMAGGPRQGQCLFGIWLRVDLEHACGL